MGYKYVTVSDALTSGAVVENSEVINLRTRLEGLRMGLQFTPRNSKSYHVYRDGNPYCMGWIGYDDFQHSTETPMYAVYSYNITNEKYASYSDEHHMRMTKNVDTAIRNAKKYLRVLSPHQLVKLTRRSLHHAIGDTRDVLSKEVRTTAEAVFGTTTVHRGSDLYRELRHMANSGYEFVEGSFRKRLLSFFAADDTLIAEKEKPVNVWFVRVFERFGKQSFEVVGLDNAENNWNAKAHDEIHRYNSDTVPEELAGKLSVLNMLQDKQYVDGVGQNCGEGMFYVCR